MTVTITLAQLSEAMRITVQDSPTGPQRAIIQRLLEASTELVNAYAPDCPPSVGDEAIIRLSSYLADSEPANPSRNVSTPESAFRNSGARGLLAPWRSISSATVK